MSSREYFGAYGMGLLQFGGIWSRFIAVYTTPQGITNFSHPELNRLDGEERRELQ
jgi:hypothetical protein